MISLRSLFLSVFSLTLSLSLFSSPTAVSGADWAVLIAGSSGFDNYRHQADVCHAYQLLHSGGIPDSHLIVLYADDIAADPSNPFPGKIFNRPTNAGVEGKDVYAGCKKDYSGSEVTPANFLAVLTGDETAVPMGKPVLKSSSEDRVFINFVDHGATGLIAFPDGSYLYAADLNHALQTMNSKGMYRQLVFYLEACESGSMFDSILPSNISIYATTAANPDESSWGTYCPGSTPGDSINGVELNTCLGDLYSVNWMEDADSSGLRQTIAAQMDYVVNMTQQSHVMQYGDQSLKTLPIGDFEGNGIGIEKPRSNSDNHIKIGGMTLGGRDASHIKPHNHVNSRDIGLHNAFHTYTRSSPQSNKRKEALMKLAKEVDLRLEAETLFDDLSESFNLALSSFSPLSSSVASSLFAPAHLPVVCDGCCKKVDGAIRDYCGGYNDYSLQYHRVVVNACEKGNQAEEWSDRMVEEVKGICAAKKVKTIIQM